MSKNIVIIDDDPMIRFLVQEYLTVLGFSVLSFAGGAEGLESLELNQADLVVLDMQMPEMNGLQVLEKIRSSPTMCEIPVLMLSANASEAQNGPGPSADQYLEKPFQMQSFLEAVKSTQRALKAD